MMDHDFDQMVNIQLKKELYHSIWTMARHAKTLDIDCQRTIIEYALCYNPYTINKNIDKDTNKIAHYSYISDFSKRNYDGAIISLMGKHCVKAMNLYNEFNQKQSRYNE